MNRKEKLKEFMITLNQKKAALQTAHQDYEAHEKSFMAWLAADLKISTKENEQVLLPEILMKWDESSDIAPKNN